MIGNPSIFAIESGITVAWDDLRWGALGFFVLHVGGFCYGLRGPHAASLGISAGFFESHIGDLRGSHVVPFAETADAGEIADAWQHCAGEHCESYFGLPGDEYIALVMSKDVAWLISDAEAFDDGSRVLQFDVGDRVRIIAFQSDSAVNDDWISDQAAKFSPAPLRDIWLPADEFYGIVQQWRDAFLAEWESLPKMTDDEYWGTASR